MTSPTRLCIVTNEVFGPHKNGGIGTSQTHLAILLAGAGFAVDILYTGEITHLNEAHWIAWYAQHQINFLKFEPSKRVVHPLVLRKSHQVYEFLKSRSYSTIVFQDWGGEGYATTCAKRTGEFASTTLVTWLHSPQIWLDFANRWMVEDPTHLMRWEVERIAVEQSDVVLSPSQYMIDWLGEQGWKLNGLARKLPLYIPDLELSEELIPDSQPPVRARAAAAATIRSGPVEEIVFFGRLEKRKGIEIFAAALKEILPQKHLRRITLLGKAAGYDLQAVKSLVGEAGKDVTFAHFGDLNSSEAMAYVRKNSPLVIMPSLADNSPCVVYECLNNNVFFITTNAGGMAELVADEEKANCITNPAATSIAALLRRHLEVEVQRKLGVKPRLRFTEVASLTISLFKNLPSSDSRVILTPPFILLPSDVTIVLTHYERPHMIKGALEAIALQNLTGFKVIVVDDGSPSLASKRMLEDIRTTDYPFDLKIIAKKENQYLGAARNSALKSLETTHVIFLDDDNFATPNMVERFVLAVNTSGADVISCMMTMFDGAGSLRFDDPASYEHWTFAPKALSLAPMLNVLGDATSIYRVSALKDVGGFHECHGVTHEDWQLHIKLAVAEFRHEYIPVPLFWYRGSANSMIRTTDKYLNNRQQIRAFQALLPDAAKALVPYVFGVTQRADYLEARSAALEARIRELEDRQRQDEMLASAHLKRLSALLKHRNTGKGVSNIDLDGFRLPSHN